MNLTTLEGGREEGEGGERRGREGGERRGREGGERRGREERGGRGREERVCVCVSEMKYGMVFIMRSLTFAYKLLSGMILISSGK